MTLWPFRRKDARKRPRSGAPLSDGQLSSAPNGPKPAMTRAASIKKQRTEPAKLQRRPRAYSFSPGRHDSIRMHQSQGTRYPARQGDVEAGGDNQNYSASQPLPTLFHGSSQQPARRKSSKRRREDHEREAEIKAMSAQTPTRLTPDSRAAGYLSWRGSKRAKTTSISSHWNKPSSNVSLPLFDSIDSSQSSDSDCVSFKVSALDVLAPRPTLRCASASRWMPSRASAPTRAGSQKQSLIERDVVAQDVLDSRQRVYDLADGLDASDLRELLERDSRRRERKRQRDQERMNQKLTRRAEHHCREVVEARQSGTPPPQNLERGIMGRELVGLGIEPPSAVLTSSRKPESPTSDAMSGVEEALAKEPPERYHATDAAPHQGHPQAAEESAVIPKVAYAAEPPTEPDEPVSALPQASILASILRSKKSQSKSTLSSDREKTAGEEDHPLQDSDTINKPSRLSFISFMRRGGRKHRGPGPSSFFNKSREEMQAATSAQAEVLSRLQGDDGGSQANYMASKPGTGTPRRTRSRFREDLPDYPLSPPDSRVQSPEAEPTLYAVDEVKTPVTTSRPASPILGDQLPTSARSTEVFAHVPTTGEGLYGSVSRDPQLSTSLASIDSEGSWLSGRVGRRSAMRDGIARAKRRDRPVSDCPTSSTREDVVDDYLSRLTAGRPSGEMMIDGTPGDGRPSSDEEPMEDVDVQWGSVGAGRPLVVQSHRHDRDTTRSREGLLNCYPDSNFDDEGRDSTMHDEAVDLEQTGAHTHVDSYGTP